MRETHVAGEFACDAGTKILPLALPLPSVHNQGVNKQPGMLIGMHCQVFISSTAMILLMRLSCSLQNKLTNHDVS
jgi:hypothetical protein